MCFRGSSGYQYICITLGGSEQKQLAPVFVPEWGGFLSGIKAQQLVYLPAAPICGFKKDLHCLKVSNWVCWRLVCVASSKIGPFYVASSPVYIACTMHMLSLLPLVPWHIYMPNPLPPSLPPPPPPDYPPLCQADQINPFHLLYWQLMMFDHDSVINVM